MKVYFVSLGCPKNLTDTEVLLGKLAASGHQIVATPKQAELIIVNTCAFLATSRAEAKKTLQELATWKKKGQCKNIYVAGCLPVWNRKFNAGRAIKYADGEIDSIHLDNYRAPRIKATPPWSAYVKIAEGCANRCSYCLIPTIRGRLRVRPVTDILLEVKALVAKGVKEIIFIAQDTTAHPDFADLLRKTAKIKGLKWVRIMYTHPAHLTDEIIEVIARNKAIVKYLDLPIQHACDKILNAMERRYTRRDLENLISKIRRRIPEVALRSTVIVGFPGEGEAEFQELLSFVRSVKFERLGAFTYQKEKGTPAEKMRGQVPEKVKLERFQKIMRAQARISREKNRKMIGQLIATIIEGGSQGRFIGRSYMDAPGIDGTVIVSSSKNLPPGKIVKVRVKKSRTYDLFGGLT